MTRQEAIDNLKASAKSPWLVFVPEDDHPFHEFESLEECYNLLTGLKGSGAYTISHEGIDWEDNGRYFLGQIQHPYYRKGAGTEWRKVDVPEMIEAGNTALANFERSLD